MRTVGSRLVDAGIWLATTGITSLVLALPATAEAQTVRDSGGMRIVENRDPTWTTAKAWRLSSAPSTQIGAEEGDPAQLLNRTRYATRLSDGRIVVAQSFELRVFDAAGKHVQTIGRRGQGPGEFALGISGVSALPGDTITVGQSRAIMFFDPKGAFIRSVPTVPQGLVRDHWSEGAQFLPDGSALVILYEPEPKEWSPGIVRPSRGFVRVRPGSARADTAGFFPGAEQVVLKGGTQPEIVTRPFARGTHATAGGDRLYIGDSERYAFRAFELATLRPVMEIRRSVPPIPVTDAMRKAWASERRAMLQSIPEVRRAVEGPMVERMIAAADYPKTLPAFTGFTADRAGNLWVVEAVPAAPDGGLTYTVYDRSGRLLGPVQLPERLTVLEIGANYLIGVWRNEDDVEFVRVYSLIKP